MPGLFHLHSCVSLIADRRLTMLLELQSQLSGIF